MPVIYTPEQLRKKTIPNIQALHAAPLLIKDALEAMLQAGDIIGATSYGSLFQENAVISCASDVDWLLIFSSTEAMQRSTLWRVLQQELHRQSIHFYVPALALANIRSGNHTLCSLLHGIRRTPRRLVTGTDPVEIFARYGAYQDSPLTTLQLFASFTRFFFEKYAHVYDRDLSSAAIAELLNDAISIWKDVLACMLVRCIPRHETVAVSWDIYEQLYRDQIPRASMEAGATVASFIQEVRETMLVYDRLRCEDQPLDDFIEDYRVFLDESRNVITAAALFAEANIALYRETVVMSTPALAQHTRKQYNSPVSSMKP